MSLKKHELKEISEFINNDEQLAEILAYELLSAALRESRETVDEVLESFYIKHLTALQDPPHNPINRRTTQ